MSPVQFVPRLECKTPCLAKSARVPSSHAQGSFANYEYTLFGGRKPSYGRNPQCMGPLERQRTGEAQRPVSQVQPPGLGTMEAGVQPLHPAPEGFIRIRDKATLGMKCPPSPSISPFLSQATSAQQHLLRPTKNQDRLDGLWRPSHSTLPLCLAILFKRI